MSVLVTGGAGYIGSHIVHALRDGGEAPVVIDDLSTGVAENIPGGVPFHRIDAGDRAAVEEVLRTHAAKEVIHLAGSISVPESVAEPELYYRNNVVASLHLLEACAAAGVERFVFSSTAAVYGVPAGPLADEDDPLRPLSPYGRSKAAIEWILEDISRARGFRFVALRYFNVAGADPQGRTGPANPAGGSLFQSVARAVVVGAPLTIFGDDYPTPDGTGVRDYVHVSDIASAHLRALKYLGYGGTSRTLNVGYGRGASVRAVITAFEAACGHSLAVKVMPRRPGDLASVIAASDKIRKILDWHPEHDDLTAMARTALEWERRKPARPPRAQEHSQAAM